MFLGVSGVVYGLYEFGVLVFYMVCVNFGGFCCFLVFSFFLLLLLGLRGFVLLRCLPLLFWVFCSNCVDFTSCGVGIIPAVGFVVFCVFTGVSRMVCVVWVFSGVFGGFPCFLLLLRVLCGFVIFVWFSLLFWVF